MTRILAIIAALAFSFTIAGPARAGASSPTCRDPFYCAPPAPCSPTTCPVPEPTTCAHNSPDPTMCRQPDAGAAGEAPPQAGPPLPPLRGEAL